MTSKRELKNKIEDLEGDKFEEKVEIRINKTVVDEDLNVIDEWTDVIEHDL